MIKILVYSLMAFVFISCNQNADEIKKMELALKNKELELKDCELKLKELEAKKRINDTKLNIEEEKRRQLEIEMDLSLQEKEISLADLYKECSKAVYFVYNIDENEKLRGTGSAFVVAADGIAISNYHVFKGASKIVLFNKNGEKFMVSQIIEASKEKDFVIFKMDNYQDIPYLAISKLQPEVGEKTFAIGNPKGLKSTSFTLSEGIVSGMRNLEGTNYIQTTAEITHGSSGGPLFNKAGDVIGITSSGFKEANLNFCVNIQELGFSSSKHSSFDDGEIEATIVSKNYNSRSIIENYYKASKNENWSELISFYVDTLDRYYDKFNYSKSKALRDAQGYKKGSGIIDYVLNVRWDSFKEYKNGNITYVEYIIDLNLNRKDKSKNSIFVNEIKVSINEQGEISSIYENILSKF